MQSDIVCDVKKNNGYSLIDDGINFSPERWDDVRAVSDKWWSHELERPMIKMDILGVPTKIAKPVHSYHCFHAFYDFSVSAEDIIDVMNYELASRNFLGDSFPAFWLNFGAGVLAAFMGAELGLSRDAGTVWFHPDRERDIDELGLKLNFNNKWFKRIADIYRAGVERWHGQVQLGMTDLGGALDILSIFRPSEGLLYDLYDEPDLVKENVDIIHREWWSAFDYFDSILREGNPGYTCWASIFSSEPYYMLQCDFCYMIGPDMFNEFVKPELVKSCRRLKNAFYHLDGPGELAHLDSLLEIEELKGVQWIAGAGNPDVENWVDVYRRIIDAGKLAQVCPMYGYEKLDIIVDKLGSAKGLMIECSEVKKNEDKARRFLERYGL